MRRFRDLLRERRAQPHEHAALEQDVAWHERALRSARLHGAMPYVVEGFQEINDAVRRGHSVLLRRERCEVAQGVVVFDDDHAAAARTTMPIAQPRREPSTPLVTVVSFDTATARFVLQDAVGAAGAIQLTPRRLQQYLSDPDRMTGVALGA
jgi:hypothetical protein